MKKISGILLIAALVFSSCALAQPALENSRVKWRFKTQGAVRTDAVLDHNQMYVGSTEGKLYALDKYSGKERWVFDAGGAIVSEPVVSHNKVIVVSRNNKVYALSRKSGRVKWEYKMQNELPVNYSEWRYFSASPTVANGTVYVGSGEGNLYALDLRHGREQWRYKTNGPIRATALLSGNTLYQPSDDGFVYAINASNGHCIWRFATAGTQYTSSDFGFDRKAIYAKPILVNDSLIIASRDGNVYSIDVNTQAVNWTFSYGTTWAMSTAVENDTVFVGWSTNNHVSAIDLYTGAEKWKYVAGSHNYTTPLAVNNSVYFGSADGNLYQLDKNTGTKLGAYFVGKEIFSSPVFDAESASLFFGSDNGFIYALAESEQSYKAVYQPAVLENISQYIVVDQKLTPYLTERGYEHLDSELELQEFLQARVADGMPSVVVFAFPVVPDAAIGENPAAGLLRQYLEQGGKVMWFGDPVNYFRPTGDWELARDATQAEKLLNVKFIDATESGNYYSKSTQAGQNWGLPTWLKTTGAPVMERKGIIPLAYDEFNYVVAWRKAFHPRESSGFVSLRTWAWSVAIQDEDLELIEDISSYGLD